MAQDEQYDGKIHFHGENLVLVLIEIIQWLIIKGDNKIVYNMGVFCIVGWFEIDIYYLYKV